VRGELVIRNARLFDPAAGLDQVTGIAISDNTVTAVGAAVTAADGARILSAAGPGRHVTPGLIGMHAHAAAGALTRSASPTPGCSRATSSRRLRSRVRRGR
jgi:predicted amidohydrolase